MSNGLKLLLSEVDKNGVQPFSLLQVEQDFKSSDFVTDDSPVRYYLLTEAKYLGLVRK